MATFPVNAGVDARVHLELDYDVRVDTQPVYVGVAPLATATSDQVWRVYKIRYDGQGRVVEVDSRSSVAWDSRTIPVPAWGF